MASGEDFVSQGRGVSVRYEGFWDFLAIFLSARNFMLSRRKISVLNQNEGAENAAVFVFLAVGLVCA